MSAPQLPPPVPNAGDDDAMDALVGRLLRAGVLTAGALVVVAIPFFLARYGVLPADFRVFRGETHNLRDVSEIMRGALRLDSAAVMQFGVLVLIATPIARVALTLVAFLVRKDRAFVLLSAVVLVILLVGLVSGRI
ncbi:MAG TPA: DUF1634 domain-containing protein [Gemmatimonadaceae bacterium]|nr:DUF1634 domain-containing protein [Gemmatimonadaceae bacterium]